MKKQLSLKLEQKNSFNFLQKIFICEKVEYLFNKNRRRKNALIL